PLPLDHKPLPSDGFQVVVFTAVEKDVDDFGKVTRKALMPGGVIVRPLVGLEEEEEQAAAERPKRPGKRDAIIGEKAPTRDEVANVLVFDTKQKQAAFERLSADVQRTLLIMAGDIAARRDITDPELLEKHQALFDAREVARWKAKDRPNA